MDKWDKLFRGKREAMGKIPWLERRGYVFGNPITYDPPPGESQLVFDYRLRFRDFHDISNSVGSLNLEPNASREDIDVRWRVYFKLNKRPQIDAALMYKGFLEQLGIEPELQTSVLHRDNLREWLNHLMAHGIVRHKEEAENVGYLIDKLGTHLLAPQIPIRA